MQKICFTKKDEVKNLELPPVLRQYLEFKNDDKKNILLFRLGEFYETYFEDALLLSKTCEISLTKRKIKIGEVALAGIPSNCLENYIEKLLGQGFSISICEQTNEENDGILTRKITRTYTKGTVLEGKFLDKERNNCILAVCKEYNIYGLSYCDLSTGEFYETTCNREEILEEIKKINPSQILLPAKVLKNGDLSLVKAMEPDFELDLEKFNVTLVKKSSFSYTFQRGENIGFKSANAIMTYALETQKEFAPKFGEIKKYDIKDYLIFDEHTRKSLELTQNCADLKLTGSLLWALDKTQTPMGKRLLRNWILHPLKNKQEILLRQNAIQELVQKPDEAAVLKDILSKCYDIRRLWGKLTSKTITVKDFLALKETLKQTNNLKQILLKFENSLINFNVSDFEILDDFCAMLEKTIEDESNETKAYSSIIKYGANSELDFLKNEIENIFEKIEKYENNEREKTKIKTLKISNNKISGYFIDIPMSATKNVPIEYQLLQNLSNKSRYTTPELKDFEKQANNLNFKIQEFEKDFYKKLKEYAVELSHNILNFANSIAIVDVLLSFKDVALENNFVKPDFTDEPIFHVTQGFHPCVYKINKNFIKNDFVSDDKKFFSLLTGPNMAGKSTFLKQNAIIVIMAQMGCFVSAEALKTQIFDKIFISTSSSDELFKGNSTFMVEMLKIKAILDNATDKSLVLLDELARGTSTSDGLALSFAISEYLIKHQKSKTIFATHFHKLAILKQKYEENVENLMIGKDFDLNSGKFDRHVQRGFLNKSYGINVAKMAKLPDEIIKNAQMLIE